MCIGGMAGCHTAIRGIAKPVELPIKVGRHAIRIDGVHGHGTTKRAGSPCGSAKHVGPLIWGGYHDTSLAKTMSRDLAWTSQASVGFMGSGQ